MAKIDDLSVEIQADVQSAVTSINRLARSLGKLTTSLSGIESGKLEGLTRGMKSISEATNGISTKGITTLNNSIKKLGETANAGSAVNFGDIGSKLSEMVGSLAGTPNINKNTVSLINAVSRIGKSAEGLKSSTSALPSFSVAVREMITSLADAPTIDAGTSSVVSSISKLATAGSKAETTSKNLSSLADSVLDFMRKLTKAPNVSSGTVSLMNSIGNLAAAGSKARGIFSNFSVGGSSSSKSISNLSKSFKDLTSKLKIFNKEGKNFAQTAGLLYARFFMLIRAIKGIGKSIDSATGYIEEYNYFNTTFEKIAEENKNDFAKYGYNDAEEYAESFQKRIKEKLAKMTGFQIESNGVLLPTNAKNLGLDITQLTNYSATIAQLSDSIGLSGEQSLITGQAMAMLAGDMSSFKNLDMQQVMENFSSGLAGSTMAIRKYGIDISVASLEQTALNYGITKSVTTMSQAEKVQLRALTILNQSRVAWGDLAKTIESPSNQIRTFQNHLKTLSQQIGEIFLPAIAKVMPYVNAFAIALQRLLAYISSFLGIDMGDIIGNSGEGYSELEDGLDDISDSFDDAAKSASKFNKQLMGFDNLNVINSQSDSKSGKGSGFTPIDLTDQLKEAFSDYEKVWNAEYKKMESKAEKFADKLTKIFSSAWKSGDGSDIGSAIAKWLNKGISWVAQKGSTFDEGIKKIANALATALNGFVKTFDFKGFGGVVGKRLKAILESFNTFFKNTDWQNLGNGLSDSLNAFVDTGAIETYIEGIGTKIRSAIEFAFGAIENFDFKNLGNAIVTGINNAIGNISSVDEITGLNGWEKLGTAISDAIIGLEDAVIELLDGIEWDEVGEAIVDFIGRINFAKLFKNATKIAVKIVKGLGEALISAVKKDPISIAELAITIKGFTFAKSAISALKTALISSIGGSIDMGGMSIKLTNFSLKGLTSKSFGAGGLAVAGLIGAEIGKEFCEYVTGYDFTWSEFFEGVADWSADKTSGGKKYKEQLKQNAQITNDEVVKYGFATRDEAVKLMNRYGISDTAELEKIWNNYYPKPKNDAMGERKAAYMFYEGKENLQKAIYDYKSGNSGATSNDVSDRVVEMKAKIKLDAEEKQKFKDNIAAWSKEHLNVYSGAKLDKSSVSGFKEQFAKKMLNYKVPTGVKVNGTAMNEYQKALQTYANNHPLTLKATLKVASAELANGKKSSIVFDEKTGFSHTITKAGGGIIKGGRWKKIEQYATGGFPGMGQMFIARENGPELVGKIGNSTAVLNNDQIVSSVANGVSEAVARTLAPIVNGSYGNSGDIVIQIDGETVFRTVRKQNDSFRKRNGQSAFA